MVILER